ncbi:MAG: hypothetical protein COB14_04190 [Alphaproteobacteria bacterium]|nr:MAG: hypothetical protein COB14_04190 [Alphaproteobacteria bacterium]
MFPLMKIGKIEPNIQNILNDVNFATLPRCKRGRTEINTTDDNGQTLLHYTAQWKPCIDSLEDGKD